MPTKVYSNIWGIYETYICHIFDKTVKIFPFVKSLRRPGEHCFIKRILFDDLISTKIAKLVIKLQKFELLQ